FNLLEGTSDAAFAVTDQGEICSWNKAAEKLFGYTAKEAINKTCGSVLQGLGPLGNEMCGENCSICHRAEKHLEIPNFDLQVQITPLSEHEIEILRMFSTGKNAAEIARRLKITLQTLRNHLHHINQKLHTHNRLEAVTHAMQRRLL